MNTNECLFCSIVEREVKNWIIWEDDKHIAFLTPYPNSKGFTVLITKEHYDSYAFDLPDDVYINLCQAAKTVGKLLDEKLGVKRTAFIFEGMGINHVHAKLIPLHGISEGKWKPINSNNPEFFHKYNGFVTSKDGPIMDDSKLDEIKKILTRGYE